MASDHPISKPAPRQQALFDAEPAPWELDDAVSALTATVIIPGGPPGEFDYSVPDEMVETGAPGNGLAPGKRVRVPFGRGNRLVTGYCVEVGNKATGGRKLKPVSEVLDREPLLSPSMLALTQWMADYYLCPWPQVLEAVVPAGVRAQAGTREVTRLTLSPGVAERIGELKLGKKQAAALRALAESPAPLTPEEVASVAGCTLAPIRELRKKGLISAFVERLGVIRPVELPSARERAHDLTDDQNSALEAILRALHGAASHTILLHGVTGSGKTEVYIRAIEEVVRFGRQAILLVPEISLTPQTVARFRARFERVAVLHSHQTDTERHEHWQRIARGEIQVVVGARSAVFAPTPNLGLVVLDEEHESSFKQDKAPRYHAREVALRRAEQSRIPLVLASATPSLESWHRAQQGKFELVQMPRRVLDLPMPSVRTIDLREETRNKRARGAISRPLAQAMTAALHEGGQVILLLNRRGFSTHIQCPACGFSLVCPHCDLALTFHRADESALCHYCDYHERAPRKCPECSFEGLYFSGLGTQKLEAEIRARFPEYECLRMDTDSMRKRGSHEKALARFRDGEVRILVGTQMIAKGLDFPNVTLVGVVNADTALHLPDFRASERTFQLVTQVAGRTGRGKQGGRVLVQTLSPDAPAIVAAVRHDFTMFATAELEHRAAYGYPPQASMIRIVVRGENQKLATAAADEVARRLHESRERLGADLRVLGPAPAPMAKLRGDYRFQLHLHSPDSAALRSLVREVLGGRKAPEGVNWTVDVDPIDMM